MTIKIPTGPKKISVQRKSIPKPAERNEDPRWERCRRAVMFLGLGFFVLPTWRAAVLIGLVLATQILLFGVSQVQGIIRSQETQEEIRRVHQERRQQELREEDVKRQETEEP